MSIYLLLGDFSFEGDTAVVNRLDYVVQCENGDVAEELAEQALSLDFVESYIVWGSYPGVIDGLKHDWLKQAISSDGLVRLMVSNDA